ncbi:kinase-like domain-containing protein, partial [Mucidula mucida]
QFSHPNILRLYGVSAEVIPGRLCLLSPWMDDGNVNDYLRRHPHHDRWQCYLHSLNPCVVHGNIRGTNILVTEDAHCCLADFGISRVEGTPPTDQALVSRGAIRWLPAESFDDESEDNPVLPKKIDTYSFGCTVIEVSSLSHTVSCTLTVD